MQVWWWCRRQCWRTSSLVSSWCWSWCLAGFIPLLASYQSALWLVQKTILDSWASLISSGSAVCAESSQITPWNPRRMRTRSSPWMTMCPMRICLQNNKMTLLPPCEDYTSQLKYKYKYKAMFLQPISLLSQSTVRKKMAAVPRLPQYLANLTQQKYGFQMCLRHIWKPYFCEIRALY